MNTSRTVSCSVAHGKAKWAGREGADGRRKRGGGQECVRSAQGTVGEARRERGKGGEIAVGALITPPHDKPEL